MSIEEGFICGISCSCLGTYLIHNCRFKVKELKENTYSTMNGCYSSNNITVGQR